MDNVNKTLYIPLYGKAFVSRKGIILNDSKAEEIWNAEEFELKERRQLLKNLRSHFGKINILMDCYTIFAAKASKYKNPINDVGVTVVHGIDDPKVLEENTDIFFVAEHEMTPESLINELKGIERFVFQKSFWRRNSKKNVSVISI